MNKKKVLLVLSVSLLIFIPLILFFVYFRFDHNVINSIVLNETKEWWNQLTWYWWTIIGLSSAIFILIILIIIYCLKISRKKKKLIINELYIRSIAPKKLSAQKEAALRKKKLVDNKTRKKQK